MFCRKFPDLWVRFSGNFPDLWVYFSEISLDLWAVLYDLNRRALYLRNSIDPPPGGVCIKKDEI